MILKVTSRIARWGRLLFQSYFGCSRSHLPVRNNLFSMPFVAGLFFILPVHNANAIQLNSDSELATAGYYQLRWSGADQVFQLQESSNPDFGPYRVVYEGLDLARVMSGKPDGEYYYRVVDSEDDSQVSNVIKVTVSHHPLENAVLFFIAGAIVFLSTFILIYTGSKRVER